MGGCVCLPSDLGLYPRGNGNGGRWHGECSSRRCPIRSAAPLEARHGVGLEAGRPVLASLSATCLQTVRRCPAGSWMQLGARSGLETLNCAWLPVSKGRLCASVLSLRLWLCPTCCADGLGTRDSVMSVPWLGFPLKGSPAIRRGREIQKRTVTTLCDMCHHGVTCGSLVQRNQ